MFVSHGICPINPVDRNNKMIAYKVGRNQLREMRKRKEKKTDQDCMCDQKPEWIRDNVPNGRYPIVSTTP